MTANTALTNTADPAFDFDVIIIGAGISGLYQLYRIRELGLRVRVLEAGTGVGGTWYWNRYPGARFDSESYSYGYSWSQEVLDEWDWTEHFSPQPETEGYLNFVADKFDLRRDISFSSRVSFAHYDQRQSCWTIGIDGGTELRTRFMITCLGPLSAPTSPQPPLAPMHTPSVQVSSAAHCPQVPPQPSSPQLRPAQSGLQTHCPPSQTSLSAHVPHSPPHPSCPQDLPAQSAMHGAPQAQGNPGGPSDEKPQS